MRNHDEKVLDMARSLLPSDARHYVRAERRRINRHTRRATNQLLRAVRLGADPDLDELDLHRSGLREIQQLVAERRRFDSTAPLYRWAERRVAADPELAAAPLAERLDHFRQLLPADAIGHHAFVHLWFTWRLDALLEELFGS